MESQEGVFDSKISETAVHNRDSLKGDGKEANAGNVQVLSVDKITVERIVLESLNGSREVLLKKNETSEKLSLSSETRPNVVKCVKDERQKSACSDKFRVSENASTSNSKDPKTIVSGGQSKLPILKSRKSNGVSILSEENRIKPIKFAKSPAADSGAIEDLNSANAIVKKKYTVSPEVSEKFIIENEHNSSLIVSSVSSTEAVSSEDLLSKGKKVVDEIAAEVRQEQAEQELLETVDAAGDEKGDNVSSLEIDRHNETSEAANVNCERESGGIKKQQDDVEESRGGDARIDRDVRDRLERSRATIDDLQKNLSTKIHASTARSYKEKLLGLQANYALKSPIISESRGSEGLSSGFDKDFLEKHNPDKRLKIEEKRLLETDLDYTSDNDRASETDERPSGKIDVKRKYSEKVTEVEKRWSGEFLDNRLQRNSSDSSKSSYVEEFGSVSSRESIVDDRDAGVDVFFDRKRPEAEELAGRRASIGEPKRRTSEEILENSTVSTVDSDSCLEDRIKAVDEDIAHVANKENEIQTDDNDDIEGLDRAFDDEEDKDCARWDEEVERADAILTTAIVHEDISFRERGDATSDLNSYEAKNNCKLNIEETGNVIIADRKNPLFEKRNDKTSGTLTAVNSKKFTKPTISVVRSQRGKDGYANLIKEFAMEAGPSKVKKEEKQKKKLGFRRLLPGFFSPKDSRKDYKKKEQKDRRRYEERHFVRYQQNGNYTRSPDTMNLNEDIKRNVKLDNSLNGSIIEERLDEIKRELFPEQGPITSTPDHFLQTDDTRLLRERARGQRSYTANSSLSSIAPDERWLERSGQFGISPDHMRKYEQRQRRGEDHDSRRYGAHLERKHSLQEPNHGARTYVFQRNHAASGRISAPPGERCYIRSRAIHPVDRPLPDIPQSRLELSNYENYQDGIDQLCDNLGGLDVADNVDYRSQSGLYQNDGTLEASLIHSPPQSVPAQVKITRQPIVNQNQRAPLIGKNSKYPSSGSSQKSGDYADSSCTPNSSQKSEFSPTSSKSGEYYLNSPRSSARTSPADRPLFEDTREGIYENEDQTSQPSGNYIEEHVYDVTPSSPCREDRFARAETPERMEKNSPEDKGDLVFEQECSPNQQSPLKNCSFRYCEDNENPRTESKRETEKSREDCIKSHENAETNLKSDSLACNQAERSPIRSTSPSRSGMTATSPSTGSRARRSQPDDQILIASPKREAICQSRVPRPSNGARLRDAESPVPIADSRDGISGIVPIEVRHQYGGRNSSATGMGRSMERKSVLSFTKGISRPEPIYGYRGQPSPTARGNALASETREGRRENEQSPPSDLYGLAKRDVDERIARVKGRNSASQSPQSCVLETKRMLNEPVRRVARSPIRESPNAAEICQQRRHNQIAAQQQRASPFTAAAVAASIEGRQSSPTASQDKMMYVSASSLQREPIYEQRQRQCQPQHQPRQGQEPYAQRTADTGYGQQGHPTCGLLSPSKQETRQHLEAFYWQQKALEAHRKSVTSSANPGPRQTAPKIDLPEVREAVYWQQLKRLDEEQQRRIYEQNLTTADGLYGAYYKASTGSPTMPSQAFRSNATALGPVTHGDGSYWSNVQQRLKMSPTGKPPLMQAQKGQNQPVLIVRPQQALRDRQELSMKSANPRDPAGYDGQRSKSASPHFHRGDVERTSLHVTCRKPFADGRAGTASPARKPAEVGGVYEEDGNDGEVRSRPHPIFKRGSLIGGESVEYGSTGPKRVSFSNQPNAGPELVAGSWPTKRGTAPEPPTRRHRSEDSASDTDSVFLPQDRHDGTQDASCVSRNAGPSSRCRSDGSCSEPEYDANKPLPPLPKDPLVITRRGNSARNYVCSDARWSNEEQRDGRRKQSEEEWNPDGKGRQSNDTGGSIRGEVELGSNELTSGRRSGGGIGGGGGGGVLGVGAGGGGSGGGSGGRSSSGGRSRDEPRRHTLGGDHQPSLHHQQFNAAQQLHPLHPHHLPPHGQYGTPPSRHTTMDLESPLPRGYPPPSSTMLFDDDPGIMSEVETSSTGFRRGGKQRSSLPVVRTPSKTLERPLGLVFLQYRNETKRALLPNEITSIDTVKALFVRSFPKQLTMEYLDSPHVKVYIHDSNKDMFYELEDLRSHLRDIRDRSVLRLFESADGVTGMPGPMGVPGGGGGLPPHWEDQSYFSEPEFDSEYQHQHIHKSKTAKNSTSGSGYYVGGSSTLPRGGSLLRAYSPAASSVVGGPSGTPTQPKTLTTPDGWIGVGGVPPAKPLRSYQCGKSPLGSLGGSARFSRDSSVSLYSIPDRLHGESGYMSSPERGGGVSSGSGRYPAGPYSAGSSYEDPYYSQYSGTVTPVIDEEASGWCSDTELLEESYSLYGVKPPGRPPSGPPRSPFPPGAPPPLPPGGQAYDATRIRVEHMERQLANLTGLVQKALTHAPHTSPSPREYLQVPPGRDPYARAAGAGDEFDKHSSSSSASLPVSQPAVTDDSYLRTDVKPPKLGKDKSVSFEKSVSFSDEPPDMNSPKQHSPQHAADTKPTKPAIKSSTLPRMSSQERDRHKPTPPPKPVALVAGGQYVYRDLALTPEMYNQLRGLQKKAKDLRQEVRNLRRMSQAQAHSVRETIKDTFITIRAMLLSGGDAAWTAGDTEKIRLSREEDLYKQEMIRLEKDLTELESTVEELRGNVINRKTRVNMSDVENMALILSKSSKTVADLKVRFPSLQEGMKGLLSSEMEKVVREEKFLKEEPDRLESALRRCKKLTGTLVTLKRLASVQEQRLPNAASVDAEDTPPITPTTAQHSKAAAPVPAERTVVGSASVLGGGGHPHEPSADHQQRPENALDALLDELQTFSRPSSQMGHVSGGLSVHPGSNAHLADIGRASSLRGDSTSVTAATASGGGRAPSISNIGRKGSVDSSSGTLAAPPTIGLMGLPGMTPGGTLRRLHSYPSSSDTDTSPPIARLQALSLDQQAQQQQQQQQQLQPGVPFLPGQKPPVPERNAELLQLASTRRVPPPPPPRTSSRSPLASPTSPQLPPRNHPCNLQSGNATLRRPSRNNSLVGKEGKPPMALPANAILSTVDQVAATTAPPGVAPPPHNSSSSQSSAVLSTSNSSSCESVNSQEGLQSKRGRQEQLEQRHQELLRKQKALQEQYARLQQLQRNAAGLTTVPPAPPDLLKKTGSESNLLAKMGLGLSAASSGSLTSLSVKPQISLDAAMGDGSNHQVTKIEIVNGQTIPTTAVASATTINDQVSDIKTSMTVVPGATTTGSATTVTTTSTTATSKVYETDIL
ncbi:uncharacterized protein LOC105831681 isoform X6 [Monomorium pharaonis]|uniref:uncharacterized protein LOC105831681 isoform X6 n=1 Tax=Monomorium pharaonis TaxID=307658 RepID=UPI0017462A48|nr:uncharacterized protein LOC105831681 isoform X6 [Monomorium pharaonis]